MSRGTARRIHFLISLSLVICAFEPTQSNDEITVLDIAHPLQSPALMGADSIMAQKENVYEPIGEIDIIRIEELYHLVETLGDYLWASFEIREIPIAINKENKQELLLNHPNPSEHFTRFGDCEIDSRPVLIREGCTIFGPEGGGWATNIDGVLTAYVSVRQEWQTTDDYLSTLLHECFHVFQRKFWKYTDEGFGELPELEAEYSALIGLESRIIHDILTSDASEKISERSRMFVAVRQHRQKKLQEDVVRSEIREEFNEGTATYIQVRLMELCAGTGGIQPLRPEIDPHYSGFAGAAERYKQYLAEILPPDSTIITFFHAKYKIGMAQCLLLDRVQPGWKEELRDTSISQFNIIESAFPLSDEEQAELIERAKQRYGYEELLAGQSDLVSRQTVSLRGYMEAPGRRYRIYYGNIPGPFKWKPKGPVHHVPNSLALEIDEELAIPYPDGMPRMSSNTGPYIWGGGIERFEVGGMIFESKEVPVIFRMGYIEWIDTEPAEDGSDLMIQSKEVSGDVHQELVMITDGFELRAPKARVLISERVVHIIPLLDAD